MKNTIYILAGIVLLLVSCYEDKGNYDYRDLNEIRIEKLPSDKFVRFKDIDTLTIAPVISRTLDGEDTEYTFSWEVNYREVPGNSPVLRYPVKELGGDIPVRLKVTDNKTGVSAFAHYSLDAVVYYTRGVYALHEEGDHQELAFLKLYPSNEGMFLDGIFERNGFSPLGRANYAYVTFLHASDPNGHLAVLDGIEEGGRCEGRYTSFNTEFDTSKFEIKQFIPKKAFLTGAAGDLITGSGGGVNQLHGRDRNQIYGNTTHGTDISLNVWRFGMMTLVYRPATRDLVRYMNVCPGYLQANLKPYVLPGDKKYDMACVQPDRNLDATCVFVDPSDFSGNISVFSAGGAQGFLLAFYADMMLAKSYTVPAGEWDATSLFHVSKKLSRIYYTKGNVIYYVNTTMPSFNKEVLIPAVGKGVISAILLTKEEDVIYVAVYDSTSPEGKKGSVYVVDVNSGKVLDSYPNATGRVINFSYKPQKQNGSEVYVPKGMTAEL